MPISIRYPGSPAGVDMGAIDDSVDRSFAYGRDFQEQKKKRLADEGFLSTLYAQEQPQQQQSHNPMSLSGLGGVDRAPLPPVQDPASARVAQAHGDGDSNQIFGRFIKTVRDGGLTNPNALAAVASTGKHESGYDPKNAAGTWSDPSQSGQPGTSGGILSWRGPRLQAMQQFAKQNGDNPNAPSPETQAKFLLSENPQLIQQLQQAKSPQEAQQLMNNAWRFAGYDQQGGEAGARVQTAMGYAGQFGGQDGGAVGAVSDRFGGQPQQAPTAPQGGALFPLPDKATMRAMFASDATRPLAIELARSRIASMQDQNDPMKKLAYEKAMLEVENLRNPQAKPTDDMREYDAARRQGYQGTLQDWITSGRKAGATNVTVGTEKGFDKTVGEGYGKRFLEVQDSAQAAQRALNALDVMEQAMSDPGFYSGAASGSVASLKRYANALGLPGAEGVDSIETFSALSKQAALDAMGGSLGSGFSNADRDFVTGQVPALENSPQGNRALIGIQRKLNERKQDIAKLARQYASQNDGRIDGGFDDYLTQWAEKNPLFPSRPAGSGASRGAGTSTGRQRARNPQTGEEVEWDGRQWSPVR